MKLLLLCIFLSVNFLVQGCDTLADKKSGSSAELILTASTPADSLILSMLGIDTGTKVDFIRWDLRLDDNNSGSDSFSLNVNYGVGQPNTLGFINGGQHRSLRGHFSIVQKNGANIFRFTGNNPAIFFSMVKVDENLFHLLTPDLKLMVGNGGWSYTLNRKEPSIGQVMHPTAFSSESDDKSSKLIYGGRTPCNKLADLYNLDVSNECIKLKWKLTLYNDPVTFAPSTYTLSRTGHRESQLKGTWTIHKGLKSNPEIIIYQLDPDKPDESLYFMKGDENVLFFLDRELELMVGDHNFSYTLNKLPG